MADVGEELGLELIETAELLVRGAQLAVGVGDLLRAPVNLDLHLAGPRAQRFGQVLLLDAALLDANEVGDVFDPVDDEFHGAARVEHRRVERAPEPLFEAAAVSGGLGDVVLLDSHRVGDACRQDALERRAQVARAGRGRILGVVGEDVE